MGVSACCRAEIKAFMPHCSSYMTSPPDPVPYCTACGQIDPEEIEPEEERMPVKKRPAPHIQRIKAGYGDKFTGKREGEG